MISPVDVIFALLGIFTVGSAIVVALSRNVVYSAVALLFAFCGVAGLYVLLSADFLAATQLLVYVGGILILIMFAVFLSNRIVDVKLSNPVHFRIPALVGSLALFGVLASTAKAVARSITPVPVYKPTTAELGELLMTKYLLPFEVASVLLLAALIGAALLSRPDAAGAGKGDIEEGN
jgi:NADH-quinone oxidoreductase subunit J